MNSRLKFIQQKASEEKPTNTNKGVGKIFETPYKPGFVDDRDLETVKMAVDKELSDVANAFHTTTERTADTIKRVDELRMDGENQYGELSAKIETVEKVSKADDKALAERVTTFEAAVKNEFGDVNASIVETNRVMAEQDGLLAERIDSIVGSFEGELGPLLAEIDEVRKISIDGDKALATTIDSMKVNLETQDATLDAAIKTEAQARVDADSAMASRVDSLQASMSTSDANLSAAITSEQEARVNADGALASEINRVEADYKTADGNISAAVQTETNARAEADKALAGQITTVKAELEGSIGEVRQFATVEVSKVEGKVTAETAQRELEQAVLDGKITAEEAARQYQDGVLSGDISMVNGKVETINAKWGVELDVNGKISGVIMNNNGARSNFEVRADSFKFTDTSGVASGGFSSSGGVTTFNGIIHAQDGVFNGTVNAHSGTFNGTVNAQSGVMNNVQINENCVVLGTLYADRIVGLPTGKSFGTVEVRTGGEATLASLSLANAEGRFTLKSLLAGRPMLRCGGSSSTYRNKGIIKIYLNGVNIYNSPEYQLIGDRWVDVAGLTGLIIDVGSHGGTLTINVARTEGPYQDVIGRWEGLYVYSAIDR